MPEAQMHALLDEVAEALQEGWPHYSRFLRLHRNEVAAGVRLALDRAAAAGLRADSAGGISDLVRLQFEQIGRVQFRSGDGLNRLLSAYHLGARTVWQHLAKLSVEHSLRADVVTVLADSLFRLVDELSEASARGFFDAQSRTVLEQERARADLVNLLLTGAAAPALRAAAGRAQWRIPACAALVAVAPEAFEFAPPGSQDWLRVRRGELTGMVVPDPDRLRLERAFSGTGAVISLTVPLDELPLVVGVVQRMARLLATGAMSDHPLFVADHLDAAIAHTDDRLLRALQAEVLRPLLALPPESRDRLSETLQCWLRCFGDVRAVATQLCVHPQTVRYRLRRLEELFGAQLRDPDARLKLMLALVWSPLPWGGQPVRAGRRTGPGPQGWPPKAPHIRRVRPAGNAADGFSAVGCVRAIRRNN